MKGMKRLSLWYLLLFVPFLVSCGGGGSSNPVAVISSPQITSITPATGEAGTTVWIRGSGFGATQGSSQVKYGTLQAPVTSWSDTLIEVTIPTNPGSSQGFTVLVNGQVSAPSQQFELSEPVIYGVYPSSAQPGATMTISGRGFGAYPGASFVALNTQRVQTDSWSDTAITLRLPTSGLQAGTVNVVVWVDGTRPTAMATFQLQSPRIVALYPTADNIGATLTIHGQGFGTTSTGNLVTVGGQYAQIQSWSDNVIQVTVPSTTAAGVKQVIVRVGDAASDGVSFEVNAPEITSQQPNPASEDQSITLYGQYLSATSDQVSRFVSVQGYGNVGSVVWNDTSVQFLWPVRNVLGNQNVSVTIWVGGLQTTFTVQAE